MAFWLVYQNRNTTRDVSVLNAAGAAIVPGAADLIRAVITRQDETAELTVVSGSPTPNGSSFRKNFPSEGLNRLRLDADDLGFNAGTYTIRFDLLDNADSADWKNIQRQVLVMEPS